MKNKGFDPAMEKAQQRGDEWQFGAASQPCLAQIPLNIRLVYLPDGENQFGTEDFEDCATRSPINAIEMKFNWLLAQNIITPENKQWLQDNHYIAGPNSKILFSKRFIATLSGTTPNGNSLKAPVDAIRKYGLIPESMLAQSPNMNFVTYCDNSKITQAMKDLGLEFIARFPINYEQVPEHQILDVVKKEGVGVALFAWPDPINGVYPRTDAAFDHAQELWAPEYISFDNYEPYVKHLASDYIFFPYAYRIYIAGQNTLKKNPENTQTASTTQSTIAWLLQWIADLNKKKVNMQTPNGDKIYLTAKSLLGFDASPQDIAPPSLACAETVNYIVKKAIGAPVGGGASTAAMYKCLTQFTARFVQVGLADALPGDIIIAPTGYAVPPALQPRVDHGHVGIVAKFGVLSNNSENGLLSENYTVQSWLDYYTEFGRIPTYIFRVL